MTQDRPSDLLGALPRSRPHRRSDKRPARAAATQEAGAEKTTKRAAAKSTPRAKSTTAKSTPAKSTPRAKSTPAKSAAAKSTRAAAKAPQSIAKPASARPARSRRLAQPAQPGGVPRAASGPRPEPRTDFPVLRTAVQAAAELTEIGVTLSAKALRRAVSRLPKP